MNIQQRVQLAEEVGNAATLLYLYYYDKAGYRNFNVLDDQATGRAVHWTVKKVQRERLKLVTAGWVYKRTYGGTVEKVHITIFGKTLINEYRQMHAKDPINDAATTLDTLRDALGELPGKMMIQEESDDCI